MRNGARTLCQGAQIDYKCLRAINPQAARRAVLEYLRSCGHNVSQTALVFGINRPVIYDILRKDKEGNLKDRSKAPHLSMVTNFDPPAGHLVTNFDPP